MGKVRHSFVCNSCGAIQPRWMGKCPDCGSWDALEEVSEPAFAGKSTIDPQRGLAEGWVADGAAGSAGAAPAIALPVGQVELLEIPRIPTGINELDRVLGGGLVPGSVALVAGEPGIGKSTLLLQAGAKIAKQGFPVLYVSSEESAQQVKLRAERLEVAQCGAESLFILADTNLARIFEQARRINPKVLIIDSVQMVYNAALDASPGSVTQLRRCATELVYLAKTSGIAVVLVGHVTKDGQVAGPRLLEHLVDAVLQFEGDRYHAHRLVRGIKNRYGTTLEIGLFEMTGTGLHEVADGAGVLANPLGEDRPTGRPGSVICPALQGTRCFLVEIQALTATGVLGAAKRRVSGLDPARLAMLVAVLEKHGGLRLADQDIFASVVGGLRLNEPAVDLALCLAITGAHLSRSIDPYTVVVGEVGLGGEVRRANQIEQRLREAARLGYRSALIPVGTEGLGNVGLSVQPVANIGSAMEALQ